MTQNSQIISTGLRGRCPNCHEGQLFEGFLKFAKSCESCGFDFESQDVADGPAVFVILLASAIVVPLALAFQIKLDPPVLLTLAIWIPVISLLCLALLRPFRGVMFGLQIANNAAEGQLEQSSEDDAD
ncbi:MAG: DUF983 domain-containing protein [Acidimicrobiales bacterium]|nr:DUF983 domain-containing protein [Hyphomonadaceae bacterium]RZV38415.1 MAG: DUF983 domain-containing protein [Acidimicrobiales bacterium]